MLSYCALDERYRRFGIHNVTPTDKDVVISATDRSLLPNKTLQFFLEHFSSLPVAKRLELVKKLQHQTKPKQVDKVICDYSISTIIRRKKDGDVY